MSSGSQSGSMAGACRALLVWTLFGMVVVLNLIHLYQGWVIARQIEEIRSLSDLLFIH